MNDWNFGIRFHCSDLLSLCESSCLHFFPTWVLLREKRPGMRVIITMLFPGFPCRNGSKSSETCRLMWRTILAIIKQCFLICIPVKFGFIFLVIAFGFFLWKVVLGDSTISQKPIVPPHSSDFLWPPWIATLRPDLRRCIHRWLCGALQLFGREELDWQFDPHVPAG